MNHYLFLFLLLVVAPICLTFIMLKDFTRVESRTRYAICQFSSCHRTNDYHEEAGCVSYRNENNGADVKLCGTYSISQQGK